MGKDGRIMEREGEEGVLVMKEMNREKENRDTWGIKMKML